MTASIEVPLAFVEQARSHLALTRRPLLVRDLRRRGDLELAALQVHEGYLLAAGPEAPIAQFYVAMSHRFPGRDPGADLCRVAVEGLEGFPRRFTCMGSTVGLWEVREGSAWVRGPVALSCMSWALQDGKVGYYLTLFETPTE